MRASMTAVYSLFIILVVFSYQVTSRHISCLDDCECDQADAVIRCDHGTRTRLSFPETPMNGYKFIAFTCNDLRNLPSESMLKAAFPDIEGIDVQGNTNFDCETSNMKKIPVLSDCGSEKTTSCVINKDCDWKCSTLKKLKEMWIKLKNVVNEKYHIVKEKYHEYGGGKALEAIGSWFSNTYSLLSGDH